MLIGLFACGADQWLFPQVAAAEAMFTLERSRRGFASGDPIWLLKLRDGRRLLASWQAASGERQRQLHDRRWSPGNAAPLPPRRCRRAAIAWGRRNPGARTPGSI